MTDPATGEPTWVLTSFMVLVHLDGSVSIWPETPTRFVAQREPTLVDIEAYGSQAAREAGRLMQNRELMPPAILEEPAVVKAMRKRKK